MNRAASNSQSSKTRGSPLNDKDKLISTLRQQLREEKQSHNRLIAEEQNFKMQEKEFLLQKEKIAYFEVSLQRLSSDLSIAKKV